MEVGVVGAGVMGAAIVRRLLATGTFVRVWNRSRERLAPIEALGAVSTSSLAQLIGSCDVILVCLTDAAAVAQAFEGTCSPEGRPSCILVNTGTVGPEASQYLEAMMEAGGFHYIEMPVSGGPEGALGGTLTAYLGLTVGREVDISPVVSKLATRIVACAGNAAAQRIKVLNNLCEAVNLWGAAEAYVLGRRIGLSDKELQSGLPAGRGDSRYLGVLLDHVQRRPKQTSVSLAIRCKDLELAADLVPPDSVEPSLLSLVRTLFGQSMMQLGGQADQCRCLEHVQAMLEAQVSTDGATEKCG